MGNRTLLWLFVFLLAGCNDAFNQQSSSFDREAETYSIYTFEMEYWCSAGKIGFDLKSDSSPMSYQELQERFNYSAATHQPQLERATFDNFLQAQDSEFNFDSDHDFGRDVEFITYSQYYERVDQAGGWDAFAEANPHDCGLAQVSPIGFNQTGSQALLFFSGTNGEWCLSEYHLLERQDDLWQIVVTIETAIC